MQELILYTKPQQQDTTVQNYVKVDFFNDENVSLTQVIQDIRDIDKVFTDFSKTFNLPASATNNKLFKHWYNPDIDGFDANIQSDAKIELNYQPFREGKLKLQEVKMKDNRPHIYKVTFFGKTVSLNNLFNEDKLNNLVWLDNFSYANSDTNIKKGLQTGLDFTVDSVLYTDAIIYPLITHTERYIYDSGGNLTDAGNLSIVATNNTQRGVMPEDLKPAITLSLIIKAIEDQYNITFKTGGFFDTLAFTSLYMWLHRDKGKIYIKNSIIFDAIPFTCGGNPVTGFDEPSVIDPTKMLCAMYTTAPTEFINGVYKVTKTNDFATDNYYFYYSVAITPAVGYTNVLYDVIINDSFTGDQLAADLNNTGNTSEIITLDTASNPMAIGESIYITTTVETVVPFQFEVTIIVGQTVTQTVGFPETDFCFFVSNSASIPIVEQEIRPTLQIPDMKVLDFIKGLFKTFNLTAYINTNDEIIVKTLNEFYDDSTTTYDLTKYVEKQEHTVAEALPFSSIKFDYPAPKTKLAQAFLNLNNVEYGELNYIANASKSNDYNIASPFEHMLFERLPDIATAINTEVQYGLFVDDDDKPSIGAPLIFYGIRNTNISPEINYVNSIRPVGGGLAPVGTRTTISNYWMPHNANSLGTKAIAPEYNLNFGSEINSYTLRDYGGNNNSLFQNYYQAYIQRVFNNDTRIFKYKAILSLNFLLTYSLADRIIISGRLFTINKITTNLQTGKSTIELLNEAPTIASDYKNTEAGEIKITESSEDKEVE